MNNSNTRGSVEPIEPKAQYSEEQLSSQKRYIQYAFLESQFNYLIGKLKTIVDASIYEEKQNKAMKDLISQEVWHKHSHIMSLLGCPTEPSSIGAALK